MLYLKWAGTTEGICKMKKYALILLLIASSIITKAQNSLDIMVFDAENGEVLIGATILLKGTTNGVSTNTQGATRLGDIPNGNQTIVVSFIGYQKKEIIYNFPQAGLLAHKINDLLLRCNEAETRLKNIYKLKKLKKGKFFNYIKDLFK